MLNFWQILRKLGYFIFNHLVTLARLRCIDVSHLLWDSGVSSSLHYFLPFFLTKNKTLQNYFACGYLMSEWLDYRLIQTSSDWRMLLRQKCAVQKNRKIPISAETQPSAAAACIKCSWYESALYLTKDIKPQYGCSSKLNTACAIGTGFLIQQMVVQWLWHSWQISCFQNCEYRV